MYHERPEFMTTQQRPLSEQSYITHSVGNSYYSIAFVLFPISGYLPSTFYFLVKCIFLPYGNYFSLMHHLSNQNNSAGKRTPQEQRTSFLSGKCIHSTALRKEELCQSGSLSKAPHPKINITQRSRLCGKCIDTVYYLPRFKVTSSLYTWAVYTGMVCTWRPLVEKFSILLGKLGWAGR
jgi:hypothetical protein